MYYCCKRIDRHRRGPIRQLMIRYILQLAVNEEEEEEDERKKEKEKGEEREKRRVCHLQLHRDGPRLHSPYVVFLLIAPDSTSSLLAPHSSYSSSSLLPALPPHCSLIFLLIAPYSSSALLPTLPPHCSLLFILIAPYSSSSLLPTLPHIFALCSY